MDDCLRREPFRPAFLVLILLGQSLCSSRYTHGLATFYLEGCNLLTAAVYTPANKIVV